VALLGANGAGKSTTLKAIAGLLPAERGEITKGVVEFDGQRLNDRTPAAIVKMGIALVPEGRQVFEHLSTEENLMVGAHTRKGSVLKVEMLEETKSLISVKTVAY